MVDHFAVTRTLAAPRPLVFEVLTNPESFAVWFGTEAVLVPQQSLEMEVREGGTLRAVMVLPDGERVHWSGRFVAVQPPAHLALTLTDDPSQDPGEPLLFDLEEVADGTRLTIRQDRSGFSQEQIDATSAGYDAFIDDMAELLATMQRT